MLSRKIKKLGATLRMRRTLWSGLRETLSEREWRDEHGPFLPQETLEDIVAQAPHLHMVAANFQSGNVSPSELLAISALVARRQPKLSLEIGTFDGNTTLQIAANAAEVARVLTLDLPLDQADAPAQVALGDGQFIQSCARRQRRYAGTAWAGKIVELFGDSMTFDFQAELRGSRIDLAFIDGSHSYDYVKSDTERLLSLLAEDAIVIWHDYCRAWPGVVKYLNELGRTLPLRQVAGTSVVYLDRAASHG